VAARLAAAVVRDGCCARFHRGNTRSRADDRCVSPIAAVPSESRHPHPVGASPASAPRCRTRSKRPLDESVVVIGRMSAGARPVLAGVFPQQLQVDVMVLRVIEDRLAAVAALGDVVRHALRDHACDPRHFEKGVGSGAEKSPRKSVFACTVPNLMWTGRRGWRGHAELPLRHPWQHPAPG